MIRYVHLTIEYNTAKVHKAELEAKIRDTLRYEGFGACIIESSVKTKEMNKNE